jgi:hypothetical protein
MVDNAAGSAHQRGDDRGWGVRRAGDVLKVDEYLDEHGLRRHELFRRLLQSLIELSPAGSDERSLLESLSNHVGAKGAKWETPQAPLPLSTEE